jgi:hypothetical protein
MATKILLLIVDISALVRVADTWSYTNTYFTIKLWKLQVGSHISGLYQPLLYNPINVGNS